MRNKEVETTGEDSRSRGRRRGRGAGNKWWHTLRETDPISLEPLRKLKIEPFSLVEGDHSYRFDGRVLAAYLIASEQFVNPLTRRELGLADCARLDAHLAAHNVASQSVARAWELSRERGPCTERDRLRTEAREVMRSLFGRGETIRSQLEATSEEAAATVGAGGVTVIDDDVLFASEPPRAPAPAVAGDRPSEVEAFPALEASARPISSASAWARQRARQEEPWLATRRAAQAEARRAADAARRAEETVRTQRDSRARRLAEAFGVRATHDDARWPGELLQWGRQTRDDDGAIGVEALRRLERRLATAVQTAKPVDLPPIKEARQRQRVRDLVDFYCLSSDEFDADVDGRSKYLRVRASRTSRFAGPARVPRPLLSDAAAKALPPPSKPRNDHPKARRTAARPRREAAVPTPPDDAPPKPATTLWDLLDDDDASSGPMSPPSYQRSEEDECSICLGRLADARAEDLVTLTCGHCFHTACLGSWSDTGLDKAPSATDLRYEHLLKTTSCPQCRKPHTLAKVQLPHDRW
ncbi:hypothetical protein CTAYLR_004814 [Chrysophaeum taylorii]|uniref:RING-type domain-containing protein n=1 Tax=Chrysophaeum taylorii TaxID=2483200 RepID=A0AAD7UNI4_9STRA|nr:hypothetical protein CTAYLR_004814 [Chrysophaeum taylorii]